MMKVKHSTEVIVDLEASKYEDVEEIREEDREFEANVINQPGVENVTAETEVVE